MSSLEEGDPVLRRLHELRSGSDPAARVYEYVETAHREACSANDILHVLRADNSLAAEIRDSMGRTVVCALQDDSGEYRYPVWEHSALAASMETTVRSRRVEYRRDVVERLEDRGPRVRVREDTPLADLEAPREWTRSSPGEIYEGP